MEVIQDVPVMAPGGLQDISTQYEYELISGNMKKVSYQKEKMDQLTHQYTYDDLNRLVDVMSSIDDIHYHREASYSYYDYGPLARKEIGSARVQGQDFTYTLNGWLKGMNSNTLDKTKDPGKDGTVYPSGLFAARNERVAKDVVGFSLGYYGGDYSPIGGNPAEAAYVGTAFGNGADDLFNGNIRHMVTAIEGLAIQGYAYRYDQLQRIKHMQVYRASDVQSLFAWTNSASTDEYKTTFTYDRNGNLLSLDRNGIGSELDMDRYTYSYYNEADNTSGTSANYRSNRLNYVHDAGQNYASYDDIKSGQVAGNYTYNKIGELIEDTQEDMILHWRTGDHKLSKIERTDQNSAQLEFFYNPFGQRTMKVEKPRVSGVIQANSEWKYTYYSYDANGQVMAVYTGHFASESKQMDLSEQHLYGAERLGMMTRKVVMFDNGVTSYTHKEEDVVHVDERGRKRFELTNHLGNVLAVINDRKIYNSTDQHYEPVMMSWSDYYAFGMQMPNRNGGADYRYLFNGMEHDSEVSGNGNSYTTEFRQYDPRLGRWRSLDPLMAKFPHSSPYVAFANNPVYFTDPYGLEPVNDGGGDKTSDGGGDDKYKPEGIVGPETEVYSRKRNVIDKVIGAFKRAERNRQHRQDARKAQDDYMHSKDAYLDHRYGDKQPEKAGDFERMYRKYHWGKYDGNFVRLSYNQYKRLNELWDVRVWDLTVSFLNKFGIVAVSAAGGGAFFATGGISFSSSGSFSIGSAYFKSSLITGGINSGINFSAQLYANNGDWRKVDLHSTGIAFGSGFIPGSSTFHIVRNSTIAGGVDALFDYTVNDGFRSILTGNKSLGLTISDFGFNTLGNAGGLSFGKNPFVFEAIGTGITVFPTTIGNKVVNNQIGE